MGKGLLTTLAAVLFMVGAVAVHAEGQVIAKGKQVKFDYTLTVDNEKVETTEGKQPLEYIQGEGQLIPGLEKALDGLKAGDVKTVMVKPEEGYGMPDPKAVREFDKEKFPKDIVPKVGMILEMQDPQGQSYPAQVKEMKEKTVLLDFNHPLAGKELKFDVKIVSVADAPVAATPVVVTTPVTPAAPAEAPKK
ncbi:MAG: peptidylprolyl isomerase [Candidatus Omnitrophica bacterium]|nr:peptidylprolyl isomerase [Candidatus Omnitrophota bacterium]